MGGRDGRWEEWGSLRNSHRGVGEVVGWSDGEPSGFL